MPLSSALLMELLLLQVFTEVRWSWLALAEQSVRIIITTNK